MQATRAVARRDGVSFTLLGDYADGLGKTLAISSGS